MFFVVNTTENKAYLILSNLSPPERAVGSGRGRTAVTGRWDGHLKQMARLPCADCFKSQPERAVDGRSWRAAGMDFWNKRRGFLTPIVAKVHQSGPWGRAVDGWPWRAAGMDFWNKRHGFLVPIVAEVRQSGPWTAGRDGPPGWTFETNGTDSWRRLLQKFVRAGRGRLAVTGRRDGLLKQTARIPGADCCRSSSERAVDGWPWRGRLDGLLKQTARIPGADCCRSSSERAVDGWPWRAAGMDFWNKRHGFLAPIVAEVRQSGPWTAGRDGPPGWTFETNGTDSWRRLLQKFVRAGRGSRPWTAGRDGLLRSTFETNGTDSWRWLFQKSVRSGRAC